MLLHSVLAPQSAPSASEQWLLWLLRYSYAHVALLWVGLGSNTHYYTGHLKIYLPLYASQRQIDLHTAKSSIIFLGVSCKPRHKRGEVYANLTPNRCSMAF